MNNSAEVDHIQKDPLFYSSAVSIILFLLMLICFFAGIKAAQILSALFMISLIFSYKISGTGARSTKVLIPGEK